MSSLRFAAGAAALTLTVVGLAAGCDLILGAGDYKVGAGGASSTSSGDTSTGTMGTSTSTSTTTSSSTGGAILVNVYPTFATVAPGGTQTFLATVAGVSDDSVAWAAPEGTIPASGATVSFTAPTAPGTYMVTATSVAEPGATATATVTVSANAPVYGLDLSNANKPHPRIYWNPERIDAAKAWWLSNAYAPPTDDYLENVFRSLFGYVASGGDPAYCQIPLASLDAFMNSCTDMSYGCDEARDYGEIAVLTYDWCNAEIPPGQEAAIIAKINAWFAIVNQEEIGNVGNAQMTFYGAYVRNQIEWGIASYPENTAAADAALKNALVTRYTNDFVKFANPGGRDAGGLLQEGPVYGPFYGAYVSMFAFPTAEDLGRDLWNQTPYWRGAVLNWIYLTPPRYTNNPKRPGWDLFSYGADGTWGDGAPATRAELGDFMTRAANEWPNLGIGRLARRWLTRVNPLRHEVVEATDEGGGAPGEDFSVLPLDYYDPGPQYLMGRSDWTDDATSYLFGMGDHSSDYHGHADWGTFQINRKGQWLTRETSTYYEDVPGFGGVGLSPGDLGLAHNVPLVNGEGGVPDGVFGTGPSVTRLASTPAYAYANVDLTGVYHDDNQPPGGNTAALHVERELLFLRDIEAFVVLDRFQSDTAARSKSFVFHCESEPLVVDATHLRCVVLDQELAVTTLLPAAPASRSIIDEGCCMTMLDPGSQQWRVEINDQPNAVDSYTLHVLHAKDVGGPTLAPTVVDSAPASPATGTLTVTIDDQHVVVFQKGITSSGGSVKLHGREEPLRADRQGITITDNGATWSP
ncbi:MAG: hypothetical protein U0414_41805 [Polyangiaceae bacterium]